MQSQLRTPYRLEAGPKQVLMRTVLPVILLLLVSGCSEIPTNETILGIVKAGTLPSTTKKIGPAFEEAFPGGTWDAAVSGMGEGELVTEFHSTASAEALEASGVPPIDRKGCIDGVQSPCRIHVSFQFILAPDLRSISLALVQAPKPMESGEQLAALLHFVYR